MADTFAAQTYCTISLIYALCTKSADQITTQVTTPYVVFPQMFPSKEQNASCKIRTVPIKIQAEEAQ